MITVWIKRGVLGDLNPELQKELGKIIKLHEKEGCFNFYITSKREGNHGFGSLHPIGDAVDYASDLSYAKQKKVINDDFDLVIEANHTHLEYDPKKEK